MKRIEYATGKKVVSAQFKLSACAVIGIFGYIISGFFLPTYAAILIGWDLAAATYLIWTWLTIWPLDANYTKRHALREDPTHALAEAIVLSASIVSLAAIAVVLMQAGGSTASKLLHIGFSVLNIAISWLLVHTLYTLRYAEEFYVGKPGGIDFPDTKAPSYSDFVYLAFTLGLTFQVSDTSLTTTRIRRIAIKHALLSYVYGAVIVAITINLVAGLSK